VLAFTAIISVSQGFWREFSFSGASFEPGERESIAETGLGRTDADSSGMARAAFWWCWSRSVAMLLVALFL